MKLNYSFFICYNNEIRPSVHVYRYVGKSIISLFVCQFFSIHLSLCVCMLSYLSACLSVGLFVCKSVQLSNDCDLSIF